MIAQDLQKLAAEGRPIQVGVSGAGWIGSGFVQQVAQMQGMRVPVLADPDTRLAHAAFVASGVPAEQIVETDHPGRAQDAVRRGQRVVTGSYALAAQLEAVDIVADVTPYPASGAETAWSCIQYGKDVVMVNIEADVTVGRILKQKARQAGILYTVSSGDEPGCLMELWDFVTTLGFEPVVIGKGKNNPLNPKATPDSVAESARRAAKDPYQVASYVDGSKTMFEMACAANATGCPPQQRGMLGPDADLISVSQIFALQQDGGLVEKPGVVDFVQGGAMAGGVFITVRVADPRLRADLEYLKVGKGYYYTFFRPYHLWFIEAPISVARAYLYRQTTLVSLDQPTAEVLTLAKRDLQPGETLDTFGGYTFSGVIDTAAAAAAANALPVGLAPGAVVTRSLAAGQVITWEDVQLDETQTVVRLRREQDQIITLVS
ncbi:MAG: NAD(P)H-dependent oxidoreductase [Anaerolineales bacterium]|jgi:predicted homoserine dehydrogenase-like protein